jgi:predicted nucleic acid-binding protein
VGRLIVDADVLIDYLRGYEPARRFIKENRHVMMLSVITVAELYSGYKGDDEKQTITALCSYFPKSDITEEMAIQAGIYHNRYGKSHGAGLADCLLAAVSEAQLATVVTLNKKHFPMLKNILVPYKKS